MISFSINTHTNVGHFKETVVFASLCDRVICTQFFIIGKLSRSPNSLHVNFNLRQFLNNRTNKEEISLEYFFRNQLTNINVRLLKIVKPLLRYRLQFLFIEQAHCPNIKSVNNIILVEQLVSESDSARALPYNVRDLGNRMGWVLLNDTSTLECFIVSRIFVCTWTHTHTHAHHLPYT